VERHGKRPPSPNQFAAWHTAESELVISQRRENHLRLELHPAGLKPVPFLRAEILRLRRVRGAARPEFPGRRCRVTGQP